MANKTFIPAFRASVGDWSYYICTMKYAELARQVGFAYELGGNSDLNTMIQRGLTSRTDLIREYLLTSPHRFLGALIVATWGGDPDYIQLSLADTEGVLDDLDRGFGVLTFDGSQQFFALDGQHRLKAIKEAIKKSPELGNEDICVLLVPHFDTEEGRKKTRRLFTNINRNAKVTTSAENIALDVDDGYAVLTRRFLTDHPFLSAPGRVLIFTKTGDEGELVMAGGNVPQTHKSAVTTISVLYKLLIQLGYDLDPSMGAQDGEPSDEVLEDGYLKLSARIDELLHACGDLPKRLSEVSNARDVRAPKDAVGTGHPMMRPVVQDAVCTVVRQAVEQEKAPWDTAMQRLAKLNWRLDAAPFDAIFNSQLSRMLTAKENKELLRSCLAVALVPQTRQEIKRARKQYKDLLGRSYPESEEDLALRLPTP